MREFGIRETIYFLKDSIKALYCNLFVLLSFLRQTTAGSAIFVANLSINKNTICLFVCWNVN